jgi:hypothetical protein
MSVSRPVEVDTELATLFEAKAKAHASLAGRLDELHYALGERRVYAHGRHTWASSHVETEQAYRAKVADGGFKSWDRAEERLAAIDAARAKIDAIEAAEGPLQDEYWASPWSRFFLVIGAGGHIHRDMGCSTCHPTTAFGWLPQLSGLTEADAVDDQGTRLCSVCFPSAPVEWTLGLAKQEDPNKCPGSGAPADLSGRYATCPVCGSYVSASSSRGTTPRHHKPKA